MDLLNAFNRKGSSKDPGQPSLMPWCWIIMFSIFSAGLLRCYDTHCNPKATVRSTRVFFVDDASTTQPEPNDNTRTGPRRIRRRRPAGGNNSERNRANDTTPAEANGPRSAIIPESIGQLIYPVHTPVQAFDCAWDDLRFSADGKLLAGVKSMPPESIGGEVSGGRYSIIQVWKTFNAELLKNERTTSPMRSIQFSPDQGSVLTGPMMNANWEVHPQLVQASALLHLGDDPEFFRRRTHFYAGDRVHVLGMLYQRDGVIGATENGILQWNDPAAQTKRDIETGRSLLDGVHWNYSAELSSDGSTCAAYDDQNQIEIWDIKARKKRCTINDARLGDKFPTRLKLSADGSRLCGLFFKKEFLTGPIGNDTKSATVAFIADTRSGKITSFLSSPDGLVLSIDMTSDGKFALVAGGPRSTCLFNADTGECIARHDELYKEVLCAAISGDGALVAEGYRDGAVHLWDTSRWCHSPVPAFTAAPAEPIESAKQPRITGPVITHEQEEAYLVFRLQHWLYRAESLARHPQQNLPIAQFNTDVIQCKAYVQSRGFSPALADICDGLLTVLNADKTETINRMSILEQVKRDRRKMTILQKESQDARLFQVAFGLTEMFIGGQDDSVYERRGDVNHQHYEKVEDRVVDPELVMAGASTVLHAEIDVISRSQALESLQANAANETGKKLIASYQHEEQVQNDLQKKIDAVLTKTPLPPLPETKPDQTISDQTKALFDSVTRRAAVAAQSYGGIEPFSQNDLLLMKSAATSQPANTRDSETALSQAVKDLAQRVPTDAVYDCDRAEFLTESGNLALKAAGESVGATDWAKAHDANAAKAVDALSSALMYRPDDSTGTIRAPLAWALCQSGHPQQALNLAHEIEPLHAAIAPFHINFARVLAANGRSSDALDQIEIAIDRFGYRNFQQLKSLQGLPSSDPRFSKLLAIKLVCEFNNGSAPGPEIFTLINHSNFPLDQVNVELSYPSNEGKMHTKKPTFAAIGPEGEVDIKVDPKFPFEEYLNKPVQMVLISCAQGDARIEMLDKAIIPGTTPRPLTPGPGRFTGPSKSK